MHTEECDAKLKGVALNTWLLSPQWTKAFFLARDGLMLWSTGMYGSSAWPQGWPYAVEYRDVREQRLARDVH